MFYSEYFYKFLKNKIFSKNINIYLIFKIYKIDRIRTIDPILCRSSFTWNGGRVGQVETVVEAEVDEPQHGRVELYPSHTEHIHAWS